MKPLAVAAIGAVAITLPLAAVGSVFIIGWAIEGYDRRRNQAALAKKATR